MGSRTVAHPKNARSTLRWPRRGCARKCGKKRDIKLAITERNNASAEHCKFHRGLYSARGVQSNGRHNNTWTPVVNFGRSAGGSYPRVRPLLVFSSGATVHRRSEHRGSRLLVHIKYLSRRKRPLFSLILSEFGSSAHGRSFAPPPQLRVLFRVNRA